MKDKRITDLDDARYASLHCPIMKGVIKGEVVKAQRGETVDYYDASALKMALSKHPFNPITNEPMKFADAVPSTDEYRHKLLYKYKADLLGKHKMKMPEANKNVEAVKEEMGWVPTAQKQKVKSDEKKEEKKEKKPEVSLDVFQAIKNPENLDAIKKEIERNPELLNVKSKESHASTLLISVLFLAKQQINPHLMQPYLNLAKFIISQPGINLNLHDAAGNTALHRAAWYGLADITKRLIEKGADPRIRNGYGYPAAHDVLGGSMHENDKKVLFDLCMKKIDELNEKAKASPKKSPTHVSPPPPPSKGFK